MKLVVILLFLFLSAMLYGQCGNEYPSGFYHNSQFITAQGDTMNALDKDGLYQGLHVYTDNKFGLFNDTITYTMGRFQHGLPVGDWKDHCKDGSYSVGPYECGEETQMISETEWVTKKEGIYDKVGVWNYFDKNGKLLQTYRYERITRHKTWTDKTSIKDSTGRFILIHYKFNSLQKIIFASTISKEYSNAGIPKAFDISTPWKEISYEFYENGALKKTTKEKKFFGKELRASVVKEYNFKKQVACKTKTKCKHPNPGAIIDYDW